ncbi:MAG: hypothetical protein NC121_16660 [Blautia sp.]|nr:hypothetical protein [Blautia sp.]
MNRKLWKDAFYPYKAHWGKDAFVDQETLLAGRTATVTIAEAIIQELSNTGNLDNNMRYCIWGSTNRNDLYYFSTLMEYSNQYARFGVFNSDSICTRRSWQGVFHFLCGIELELCTAGEYDVILEYPDVQGMPSFPEEGSISRVDDIIVIKISE